MPGERILDVGCGLGQFMQEAMKAGLDAYGVDVSDIAVKAARSRVGADRVWLAIADSALKIRVADMFIHYWCHLGGMNVFIVCRQLL